MKYYQRLKAWEPEYGTPKSWAADWYELCEENGIKTKWSIPNEYLEILDCEAFSTITLTPISDNLWEIAEKVRQIEFPLARVRFKISRFGRPEIILFALDSNCFPQGVRCVVQFGPEQTVGMINNFVQKPKLALPAPKLQQVPREPGRKPDPLYDQAFELILTGASEGEALSWYCEQAGINSDDYYAHEAFNAAIRRRKTKLTTN